jgi:hypothetical protein
MGRARAQDVGNRNKKKGKSGKPTTPVQNSPLPQSQPAPPKADSWWKRMSLSDKLQWLSIVLMFVWNVVACAWSAVTWIELHKQSKINQRAEDRASGKLKAKFEFVEIGNTDPSSLARFTKKTSVATEAVYLDDVDTLVRWGPNVKVKNTGEEIIDSIRVEVEFTVGAVMGQGVKQKYPPPYVVTQPSIVFPTMSAKLSPGQSAEILLDKPLLEQLLSAKLEYPDQNECIGVFQVRVSCRIVGATAYDPPDPMKTSTLRFVWLRSGFSGDQVKRILEIQPTAFIK